MKRPPALAVAGTSVAAALTVVGLWAGSWDLMWAAWVALFGVMEANAVRSEAEGDTLSERLRDWWKVKTPAGRLGFTAAWSIFAMTFLGHIVGVLW